MRIGGKDTTAHATLEDSEGNCWACEVNRSLAKEMAHFLFGRTLRVSGTARWERTEEGEWHLNKFVGESFRQLDDDELQEAIQRLRAVDAEWKPDAQELLRQLRSEDGGLH